MLYEDHGKVRHDLPTAIASASRVPAGLTVRLTAWSFITLSYSNSDGAAVEIECTIDIRNSFVRIATASGTDYIDQNLPSSTPYYYWVRCISQSGTSDYASPVTATTQVKPAETTTPTPNILTTIPNPAINTNNAPSSTAEQKSDWLNQNLSLVLIGAEALFIILFTVIANRDQERM